MFPSHCSSTAHSHINQLVGSAMIFHLTLHSPKIPSANRNFLRSRQIKTGGEWQRLGKFGHVSLSLKPLQSLIQGLALHSTLTLKSPLNALKKILFSLLPVSIVIIISVIFIITVWEEMVCRGVCWSSPWLGNNIISINGNENTLSPQSQKPKRLQADNVRFGKPYNTSLKLWFSMSFLHQFIMTNY